MRSRRLAVVARAVALAACVAACVAACATGGKGDTPPPHPVALEVNNNLPLPAQLTIYAVSESGIRTLLGDVPPARAAVLRFTPLTYTTGYRLLATLPNGRRLASERFNVGSSATGRLVWTLVPNIIGFRGPDLADTTAVDTTSP